MPGADPLVVNIDNNTAPVYSFATQLGDEAVINLEPLRFMLRGAVQTSVLSGDFNPGARTNWVERGLFSRSQRVNFLIIACLSFVFSFSLIGRQVYLANWGLIDDHEVFYYLGPGLQLSIGDIWSTLLAKADVWANSGRFRPTYYLIKMIETSLWGANVHLWYLGLTIGFAIFLSSIWWTLQRSVGGWLGGVLTASIALLPLWADVWSRLGPSESYGAACIGIMVFAADLILFCDSRRIRISSAIILTLATITLMGMKETFIPLAAGGLVVLLLAGMRRRLSPILIGVLALAIFLCVGGMAYIVSKLVATGTDYYGKPVGLWPLIKFAIIGLFDGIVRTSWLWVFPAILVQLLRVTPRKPLGQWVSESSVAIGAYIFLLTMYAAQCGFYRSSFPRDSRYDFPAMLLVSLTCCILAYEISERMRKFFPERTISYAQLTVAGFLFFALATVYSGKAPVLAAAVQKNIEVTNLFYHELQRTVFAAKLSPETPLILDAYGPRSYEAVFSLSYYLSSLGVKNPISVRFHRGEKSEGGFFDSLEQRLSDLQEVGTGVFTPFESLASRSQGCLSVGIDGPPDASCSGFHVKGH